MCFVKLFRASTLERFSCSRKMTFLMMTEIQFSSAQTSLKQFLKESSVLDINDSASISVLEYGGYRRSPFGVTPLIAVCFLKEYIYTLISATE